MSILSLVILALLGESVWETLKMIWQNGKLSADRIGALVIGEILALGAGLDMLAIVGVPLKIPYVGMILTGLLISRGANFIHDLLQSVNNIQQNSKDTLSSLAATAAAVTKNIVPSEEYSTPTATKPVSDITETNTKSDINDSGTEKISEVSAVDSLNISQPSADTASNEVSSQPADVQG